MEFQGSIVTVCSIFSVLIILLSNLIDSRAQNCGFPVAALTLDSVAEDTAVGTVLERLRIVHIADYSVQQPCTQDIPGSVFLFETLMSKNELTITLVADLEPLIDGLKLMDCILKVRLPCTDGKWKTLTLQIPLEDINSKSPKFEKDTYQIAVFLPWNGITPLNLYTKIEVTDQDRDIDNARIDLVVWDTNFNNIFMVDWNDSSITKDENLKYVFSIMLYPYNSDPYPADLENMSCSKQVRVRNSNRADGEMFAVATMNITFFSSWNRITLPYELPPIFDKSFYQLSLNLPEWKEGPAGLIISTANSVPVVFSMDDADGANLFSIDSELGLLSYNNKPTVAYLTTLYHYVGIYQVRAVRTDALTLFATVSLVVYFQFENTNETKITTNLPTGTSTTATSIGTQLN